MKKNIYLILFFILPFLSGGCQTEGEAIDNSYLQLTARIAYHPTGEIIEHLYTVTYNGQDISKTYFPRSEKEGTLQVFLKETGEKELETTITVEGNKQIEFIKLPGKSLEIYHADDYITFSASLSLFEGYKLVFNGQELVGGVNYLKKEQTNGTLMLYGENGNAPVYSVEDVVLANEDNLVIFQSSENEFLSLSNDGDEEEAPLTDNLSKVRFFYSPKGALNVDAIELVFLSLDFEASIIEEDIYSIIVEKGKLSSYIELDAAKYWETNRSETWYGYSIYVYDLSKQRRGNLIEDVYNGNNTFTIDIRQNPRTKAKYKFATYQITNRTGYSLEYAMGTEW
jgi:hypothetical protein